MRPPVAPYLTVSPAMAAIAFYTAVFEAKQQALMPALDGMRIMHCELLINGGSVMLADAFPEFGNTRIPIPGEPMTVSVSLEFAEAAQVDAVFARATGLGGKGETSSHQLLLGDKTRHLPRSFRASLDSQCAARVGPPLRALQSRPELLDCCHAPRNDAKPRSDLARSLGLLGRFGLRLGLGVLLGRLGF